MNITKAQVAKLLDFVEAYAGVSPEHECATILRGLEDAEPTVKQSLTVHKSAEDYLRYRYGAYRGHFAWRELEEAYSQGRYDEEMLQGPNPYPGDEPSPQAAPQPTPPAECKNGCPPRQICDFCQGTGGKDKPPQAAQAEAALSEVVRLSEDAGLYDFPAKTEAQ